MRIIAFTNQKGGVGKTTSVLNVGAGLARFGRKVLLIDLDPQSNLTEGFGIKNNTSAKSIYDVIIEREPLKNVILNIEQNLDLVRSSIDLSGAEVELIQLQGKEFRLKKALKSVRGYDYALIDCPPSLGQLTLNALVAAQEVFIPIQTEFYALKGLQKLLSTIEIVHVWKNKSLEVKGLIGTMYDPRKILNRDVVLQLREHFGAKFMTTLIRDNVSLAEAPTVGKNIFDYKNNSYGSEDYAALCSEIIKQEGRCHE